MFTVMMVTIKKKKKNFHLKMKVKVKQDKQKILTTHQYGIHYVFAIISQKKRINQSSVKYI